MTIAATLGKNGQVTIPKKIRDCLNINPGDRVTFTAMPDGGLLMRIKNKSIMNFAGVLQRKHRKAVSVEQLSR